MDINRTSRVKRVERFLNEHVRLWTHLSEIGTGERHEVDWTRTGLASGEQFLSDDEVADLLLALEEMYRDGLVSRRTQTCATDSSEYHFCWEILHGKARNLVASSAIIIGLVGCGGTGDPSTQPVTNDSPPPTGCMDAAGRWSVAETATYSCSSTAGPTTKKGVGPVVLKQTGCRVGYSLFGIPRSGSILGRSMNLTGFLAIAEPGATVTENRFDFGGTFSADGLSATVKGSGRASGSLDGETETCTAQSTATMNRCAVVAVAVMRGGSTIPGTQYLMPQDASLNKIAAELGAVNPYRIVQKVFDSDLSLGNQAQAVKDWVGGLNTNCDKPPAVMLVGHSLGGHVAMAMVMSNVCARAAFDPFNEEELLLSNFTDWDQRKDVYATLKDAPVLNYLAESPWQPLDMRGYQMSGPNLSQAVVPDSNHANIPTKVYESPKAMAGLVTATRNCLAQNRE